MPIDPASKPPSSDVTTAPVADSAEETLVLEIFKPDEVLFPRRNQNDLVMIVSEPAKATSSSLTLEAFERISRANGLHTDRADRVITAIDRNTNRLYVMPVARTDGPHSIPVRYIQHGFSLNLYNHLGPLDRLVAPGEKHVYRCETTKKPIQIGEFTGLALYIDLNSAAREAVRRVSQSRQTGAAQTQPAPQTGAANTNTATPNPSGTPDQTAAALQDDPPEDESAFGDDTAFPDDPDDIKDGDPT